MLQEKLLTNYSTTVRPVRNHSHPVNVELQLTIAGILGFDEKSQTLTLMSMMRVNWVDEYLRWNEADYAGIDATRLKADQIWRPDIHLYNNMDKSFDFIDTLPIIYYDGTILHMIPIVLKSSCAVDVSNFPFDSQNCTLTFGSWTYNGNKVNLTNRGLRLTKIGVESSEFKITEFNSMRPSVTYDCCPEPYLNAKYTLLLKRRTDHATHFIMSPCIICSLLIPFIFLLPRETNDKIIYGKIHCVINTLFVAGISWNLWACMLCPP
ncbi:hypothetical protein CAPTEDRAFT_139268 [Capitella teleta]|uniref:Neurotransmitter-gated ion-channel ligand-binding domain-containing protein n=1 Tax=Capitella teleta TaxID=283909 RepID=R7TNR6_CAPTE|nr:hypothetical protein CAPTEDRAFT_139268 [Capitella teleta]|eukprot:ELT95279.1 hypothetical protein CAPTEDRAFT_139268 [Capitella teleta]